MTDLTPRQAAWIAGIGYLVIIVLALFAEFHVRAQMWVPGDAAATTQKVMAAPGLFRAGIVSYLVAAIFDVIVAVALYVLLRPVNKSLSVLAAWMRLAHAVIFALALNHLLNVLVLAGPAAYMADWPEALRQAHVLLSFEAFNTGWLIGLVFFGLHCILLGYLVFRSGFMPRLIGVLLAIAGVGYLIDSFAHFLMPNYSNYEDIFLAIVALPAIVAEVALCLWLLIKGTKPQDSL